VASTRPAAARPPRRYGILLMILIASYLLSAFFDAKWINDSQAALFTAAVLLTIRNAGRLGRRTRAAIAAGLVGSMIAIIVAVHLAGPDGRGAAAIWTGLLLLLIVVLIVRQVLTQASVTLQSIYGAISTYLIIGLMFASFYSAMWWLQGRTFFAPAGSHRGSLSDFQYFSFTTLTTLGYGDFTAVAKAGRAVAMIEAMTGQIFLATLVAKLVAAFRPASAAARQDDAGARLPAGTDGAARNGSGAALAAPLRPISLYRARPTA